MQEFLSTNIKEIIQQYPPVEEVLQEYDIACVTCNVGTCQLIDIIEIHDLSSEQQQAVLSRIAKIVFPDREIKIPTIQRQPHSDKLKLSPPVNKLVQEHVLIKRLIHFIPFLLEELKEDRQTAGALIEEGLDFIRSYADRFHHAKEEEVLFKHFDENAEIFQVMHQDHEQARSHVRQTQAALDKGDDETVSRHLLAYRELLEEHIKKEDEVLYPWIDRNLSVSQVGELYSKFTAIDGEFDDEPKRHERYIRRLEETFQDRQAGGDGKRP